MNFVDCLLYAILAFLIMIASLGYIWAVLDIYYTRKEQHISKMLDGSAKAIKNMSNEFMKWFKKGE